jgi:ppGpp synthetase/RelA/SpoT-type nucleotidyltranferase
MLNEQILTDYSAARPTLVALGAQLEAQLQGLVVSHALPAQFVTHRIKSLESLRRKVSRPDRSYRRLWDLTDLIGLRVAAYFEDTLEPLARLIEGHFAVDFSHSTDKQRFTEDARFGYRSLHYVCALPEGPDPQFRFEIQLRTVLQHAWAEVEHDLGYQAANAVPERIKRRFSRIASLLEIADQEFVAIKSELRDYQATVQQALARPGEALPIDAVSLASLGQHPAVAALDAAVAARIGKGVGGVVFFPDYLVKMLRLAGLTTTREVLEALEHHAAAVPDIVSRYFDFTSRTWQLDAHGLEAVLRGYGLFFVAHLAILRGPALGLSKVARLTQLYVQLDYPGDERTAQQVASGLVAALG